MDTKKAELPPKPPIDWGKLTFLVFVHLVALVTILLWITGLQPILWSWRSGVLAFVWFALSSTAITAGYHRLFSHPSHKATSVLELFHLLWGAAAVQGSALQWSAQHRDHHTFVDGPRDPYNIQRGFWWAHVGWVFHKTYPNYARVPDLTKDHLVSLQHHFELPLTVGMGFLAPAAVGMLWGEALGAFLVVSFVRLVIQWHMTFCVNSLAHYWGDQQYSTKNSSRSSFMVSLFTWGEGNNHNRHHSLPTDYRTGVEWYAFDPAKWFIWTCSKIGLASNLRRYERQVAS